MADRRRREQGHFIKGNEREKGCSFKMNESLYWRMDSYVKSENSRVKSKTSLIETAILEFLDREEPIAKEIGKVRYQLEKSQK
jgi:predicted transcriptional regulator